MIIDTPGWVRDAVFYQVFPDRLARSGRVEAPGELEPWDAPPTRHGFKGGDLYGVVDHLDRLRELGITALYLNPVFTSASNHRYHTDDYLHVDPLLGGDDALRELIDEAHAREMRVVLDGVFNHCGRGFWPFHHVLENGMQSPYRDWFHLHDDIRDGRRTFSAYPDVEELAARDELAAAGRDRGSISPSVFGYEAWWDLPALPKLNLDEPHVRAMVLDVAEHWLRFGADGWRLDVAEEIGADFWREFRQRARAAEPEAYLVAEIWSTRPEWLKGDMFDAFMDYPLGEAILGLAAGSRLARSIEWPEEWVGRLRAIDGPTLADRILELQSLHRPEVNAVQLNLLGSHDTPRLMTMCGGDVASVRLATLFQMTLPGAPCVYYGDEIGMEGEMDPGCRAGFPVDPAEWTRDPYGWTADLIALRHSSRALRDGELSIAQAEGSAVAYLRRYGEDAFMVVANAEETRLAWRLELPLAAGLAEIIDLRGAGEDRSVSIEDPTGGSALSVELGARDGMVVRLGT